MWALISALSLAADTRVEDPFEQLSTPELVIIVVITGPLIEELIFRGAFFSAAARWRVWAAVFFPSLIWGALHFEDGGLTMALFFVAGVILAMLRWKSGSIYIPLCLHSVDNLVVVLALY